MSDPLVTIDGIAVRKYNGSGSCQVENQTVYIEAYSRQDGKVFITLNCRTNTTENPEKIVGYI